MRPSDKWMSSPVRYGEVDTGEENGGHTNGGGTENVAYLKSTASLDNKQYESGL